MPPLVIFNKTGLPIIYKLPDGEIVWPGVIVNPKTGVPSGKPHDAFTLQALAGVLGAKDNLHEKLRPAAEKFIEAALAHLSDEHGDEMMIFIPPGGSPGLPTCGNILQRLRQLISIAGGVPVTEVKAWEEQLLFCYRQGKLTEAEYNAALNEIKHPPPRPPGPPR